MSEARFWWLSFADPQLPEDEQFLGVSIVNAHDFIGAVTQAHVLGINPGGEIAGYGPFQGIDEGYVGRLLSKDEAMAVPEPVVVVESGEQ